MMKTKIALLGLILFACNSKEQPSGPLPGASAQVPGKPAPSPTSTPTTSPNPQHGGITFPTTSSLAPSIFSGTTAVDLLPRFAFHASLIGSQEKTISTIQEKSFFQGPNERIPAKVLVTESKDHHPIPLLEIFSASELTQDAWYTLDMNADDSVKIHAPNDADPLGKSRYALQFFTGSAPQLIEAYLVDKSNTIYLRFSEPVDKMSLPGRISVLSEGKTVPLCVVGYEGKCLESSPDPWMHETAELKLSNVTKGALTIKIDGQVMGSGRTVAEGSKFLDPKRVVNGSLVYALDHTIHTSNGDFLGFFFGELSRNPPAPEQTIRQALASVGPGGVGVRR